jgi:voltage-gated potassium channel Kch
MRHIQEPQKGAQTLKCRTLSQAGATAVVPETLEPSLQLASAVLSQLNMPPDDVQEAIQEFRRAHMGELQVLLITPPSSVISSDASWIL